MLRNGTRILAHQLLHHGRQNAVKHGAHVPGLGQMYLHQVHKAAVVFGQHIRAIDAEEEES